MGISHRHPVPSPERWQPPGHRWGFGARSVLPYLNHSLQAKALVPEWKGDDAGPIRNPVFQHMEGAPRKKRR
jgi:hypothetical protein